MLFFLLLAVVSGASVFDGKWQMDKTREIGSCDAVLRLIGVSKMKIGIIAGMGIVEHYALTADTFHIVRDTIFPYTHSDKTYRWGVEVNDNDAILGDSRHTVTLHNMNRIETRMVRPDGALYTGTRKPYNNNVNTLIYLTNYTTADEKHASCARIYVKINT
jgi:hypothetical protein